MLSTTGMRRLPSSFISSFSISGTWRFHVPGRTFQQIRLRSTSGPLPKIAQPEIWASIVPKFLRNGKRRNPSGDKSKSKEWNPASFFIIIFLLIGSQAIQLLILRQDFASYNRKADAKLALLSEVIEKIKNGEQVDVEKLLGTGDEAKEREWDEVLREIEEEDSLWHRKSTEQESNAKSSSQLQSVTSTTSKNLPSRSSVPSDEIEKSASTDKRSQAKITGFY